MAWSKNKADRGNHIDRISDLPNHIIDSILEHLNILELVRTSTLSKKWRYVWISVPKLCFEQRFFRKCAHLEDHEISRIITEVLLVHNGPIYKFTLYMPITFTISIDCLSKWFLFLSRNCIKDLRLGKQLSLTTEDLNLLKPGDLIQVPSHVFYCQELTFLELYKCKMLVPPNFSSFKNLLELRLYYVRFDSGALESLVSGCPLLQHLNLWFCCGFKCIDISAPTLKVLTIYCDQVIESICLKRVKNLIDLSLVAVRENAERGSVTNLITGFPQIQRLAMGPGYNKILSLGTIPLMLQRSFSSLEYLKLILNLNKRENFMYTICLLQSAPNLVELVIQGPINTQVPYDSEELECSSSWRLSKLRTVKITCGARFQGAMSLIRLILANSSSLETLTFHVGIGHSQLDASMLLSISEDLFMMERASQRAKIVFLHEEKEYD